MLKKFTFTAVLAMGASLPFGAMASSDEEVTIRVMEMHEYQKESVMKVIELPDVRKDDAGEQTQLNQPARDQKHTMEQSQEYDDEGLEMERDLEREQAADRETGNHGRDDIEPGAGQRGN